MHRTSRFLKSVMLALVVGVLLFFSIMFVEGILRPPVLIRSPRMSITSQGVLWMRVEIMNFCDQYKRLPSSRIELEAYSDMTRAILDEWDRKIMYKLLTKNRYELRSMGRDGILDTSDDLVWDIDGGGAERGQSCD